MKRQKKLIFSLLTIFLLTLGASSALADITYTIGTGNVALNGFPGPYATLAIHLASSTVATATFNSLNNGTTTYLLGGAQAADVNVNASAWTISALSITNSLSGFSPGPISNGGSNAVDGFGTFNQTTDSFDGFQHSGNQVSFTLTNTSGTWASASNVLINNASGFLAAVHVFTCADPCTSTSANVATGFAAVPEPRLLSVLAIGLAGLFFQARRKRSAKTTSTN